MSILVRVYWFLYTLDYRMWYMCKICCEWRQPAKHLFNIETGTCHSCLFRVYMIKAYRKINNRLYDNLIASIKRSN